jgi:hypothetical protein
MRAFGVRAVILYLCEGETDPFPRVLSVKGKKVLHIDRNDHYGGSELPLPAAPT